MVNLIMACAIKICGVTGPEDASLLSAAGIDYLGVLVNVTPSPRSVTIERASGIIAASKAPVIVLTCDHSPAGVLDLVQALRPAGIQLAGSESEGYIASLRDTIDIEIWKSVHLPVREAGHDESGPLAAQINRFARIGVNRVVLDTALTRNSVVLKGGTGQPCDWSIAARVRKQVDMFLFLAGGIHPGNVSEALLQVRPDGVDVSSGVERSVGRKDAALVRSLVSGARMSEHNRT
jgi:phosphoribosylanthranilate isomerase